MVAGAADGVVAYTGGGIVYALDSERQTNWRACEPALLAADVEAMVKARIGGRAITIRDTVRGGESRQVRGAESVVVSRQPGTTPAPTYDSKWEERYAKQAFFIPGPLPGMNDYISTGSRFTYNTHKKQWQASITVVIAAHGLGPMPCAWFRFHWREKDRRRNPDNFAAIGKKFIFDALVNSGILNNDGWDQVLGWEDRWSIDTLNPGVYVEMFDLITGESHAEQD